MIPSKKRDPREVLPEIRWDTIAPPYPDCPFFQGAEEYPFRPQATDFDLVNAWWLIKAATLSYSEEEEAEA